MIREWFTDYRRSRAIRMTVGLAALFLLVWRLEAGEQTLTSTPATVFIWGAVFLTTVLLVWREKNYTLAHRRASEEDARFIAAAETSPDAFFLLDAVRNKSKDIIDFRFAYVNSHAEVFLKMPPGKIAEAEFMRAVPDIPNQRPL